MILVPVVALLLAAFPVHQDTLMLAGRRAVVWVPERGASAGRLPVVLFSHGLGGCPTQSGFLTAGLAAHGYLVIAPFHRDAGCGRRGPGIGANAHPPVPFDEPSRWNDRIFADRLDDMQAIVAALPSSVLGDVADLDRVAVAGHSLGGFTALGLGGGWRATRLPDVRAVLALAPYATPFLARGTLSSFATPVMYQTGALDKGTTRALVKSNGVYDQTAAPKYLVEFAKARHSSWGNRRNPMHDAMLAYALSFLDRYVRGAPSDASLTTRLAGVADFRFDDRGVASTSVAAAVATRAVSLAATSRPH